MLGPWVEELSRADAVVNLAGESIFGRWTDEKKRRLRSSRVDTSRLVAEAFAAAKRRPLLLLQGSAVGYYGDTADRTVDESAPAGADFLARLTAEWEGASASVERLGVRRPILRSGIVLSRQGGALRPMAVPSAPSSRSARRRAAVVPWIHQADEVGAIRFCSSPAATGPSTVAPEPARNGDLSRAVGKAGTSSWLPAPKLDLRLALGELGETLLAASAQAGAAAGARFQISFRPSTALADLLG